MAARNERWLARLATLAIALSACAAPPAPTGAKSAVGSELSYAPSPRVVAPSADAVPDDAPLERDAVSPPDANGTLVTVQVPGDRAVLVMPGEGPTPIIYLHGRCGDPTALRAWARAARKYGTLISLVGETGCKGGMGRTKWTLDATGLDRRIDRAISAVRTELGIDLADTPRVAVGYSQGALRAEALATRMPDRYPRVVLIAGPRAPRKESLRGSEAVLLVGGDHDARGHLMDAAHSLAKGGKNARYIELLDARHGDYGSAPVPTLGEGLGWLFATPGPLGAGPHGA